MGSSLNPNSSSVLLVADVLHPVHRLAAGSLLNGDVSHGRRWRRPVPVFLSWREPDHIPGVNLLDRGTFPLNPSTACRDNQCLSERMRMPGGTRSRLKGDAGATDKRRVGCLKERVDTDSAGKPVCRTFA